MQRSLSARLLKDITNTRHTAEDAHADPASMGEEEEYDWVGSDSSMPDLEPIFESSDDDWTTSSDTQSDSSNDDSDDDSSSDSSSDASSDWDTDTPPYMPPRLSMLAPKFDGNPESLERFFSDVEMLSGKCNTEGFSTAEWALEYLERFDDYNLWRMHAAKYLENWEWFKDRIRDLYPDAREPTYTLNDLHILVETKRVVKSIGDIAEYYRKFVLITQTLRENEELLKLGNETKLLDMFLHGLVSDVEFVRRFMKFIRTTSPAPGVHWKGPGCQRALELMFKDLCDAWKAEDP